MRGGRDWAGRASRALTGRAGLGGMRTSAESGTCGRCRRGRGSRRGGWGIAPCHRPTGADVLASAAWWKQGCPRSRGCSTRCRSTPRGVASRCACRCRLPRRDGSDDVALGGEPLVAGLDEEGAAPGRGRRSRRGAAAAVGFARVRVVGNDAVGVVAFDEGFSEWSMRPGSQSPETEPTPSAPTVAT